jgi:hypothetical protein
MGYASYISDFNPENSFEDKQWPEPVIFRFNNQERRVFITVESMDWHYSDVKPPTQFAAPDFTEVVVALPISKYCNTRESQIQLLNDLERYYRIQKLAKSRVDFSFTNEGVVD